MISKKIVLLGGLSLLIGTASVAAAKEAMASEQITPAVLTAQKRPDTKVQRYDLTFIPKPDRKETLTVNGKAVPFYAYENRVYVSHPKAAESESLTLYIPAAYLEGGRINGYSAKTAPIFMPNGVGGYMPGEIQAPSETNHEGTGPNAVLYALSRGYVVAAPAIRGRTTTNSENTYVGKAPALIVDYKAARSAICGIIGTACPRAIPSASLQTEPAQAERFLPYWAQRETATHMSLISKRLVQPRNGMIFLRPASIALLRTYPMPTWPTSGSSVVSTPTFSSRGPLGRCAAIGPFMHRRKA